MIKQQPQVDKGKAVIYEIDLVAQNLPILGLLASLGAPVLTTNRFSMDYSLDQSFAWFVDEDVQHRRWLFAWTKGDRLDNKYLTNAPVLQITYEA